jgi:hypothetical protein
VDTGIEPRTVATLALAVRRSNLSATENNFSKKKKPRSGSGPEPGSEFSGSRYETKSNNVTYDTVGYGRLANTVPIKVGQA